MEYLGYSLVKLVQEVLKRRRNTQLLQVSISIVFFYEMFVKILVTSTLKHHADAPLACLWTSHCPPSLYINMAMVSGAYAQLLNFHNCLREEA